VPSSLAAPVIAFIKLGRPLFLIGGFVLYGLGAALAAVGGAPIDRSLYAWGQLVITAAQLMTHYSNDYFDLQVDIANATPTRWSGGSRVLPGGALRPGVALGAALVLGAASLAAALNVAARVPSARLALPLALIILALSWFYSAPPLRLCARGLGELTTAIVVTLLTPLFGYYLQAGALRSMPVLAVLPLCALQFAMLLAIEFPDAAGDAAGGKRTLVVRLGVERAERLYVFMLRSSFFALLAFVFGVGLPAWVALPAFLFPLSFWLIARAKRGAFRDPARWESMAFWSVALLIAASAAELAGALWSLRHSP